MGYNALVDEIKALAELVGDIYACAHASDRWPRLIERVCGLVGASAGSILFIDHQDGAVGFATTYELSAGDLERYRTKYVAVDPLSPRLAQLAPGKLYHSQDVVEQADFMRTEYYEGYCHPMGVGHLAGGAFRRDDQRIGQLVLFQDYRSDGFDRDRVAQVDLLLPHLDRSFRLFEEFASLKRMAEARTGALEAIGSPLVICDAEGRVAVTTSAARLLMERFGGLEIAGGRLTTANAASASGLKALLRRAAGVMDGELVEAPEAVHLAAIGRPGVTARALPLLRDTAAQDLWETTARVVLVLEGPPVRALAEDAAAKLSARQREVAELALGGATVADIGRMLGISENTSRDHMKSIYRKLEVGSRVQLFETLVRP